MPVDCPRCNGTLWVRTQEVRAVYYNLVKQGGKLGFGSKKLRVGGLSNDDNVAQVECKHCGAEFGELETEAEDAIEECRLEVGGGDRAD